MVFKLEVERELSFWRIHINPCTPPFLIVSSKVPLVLFCSV